MRSPVLERFAELIIAVVELLEAEARVLRRQTARLAGAAALIALTAALGLSGTVLCLWGLYQHLSQAAGPANGALLTGLVTFAIAGAGLWFAVRLSR